MRGEKQDDVGMALDSTVYFVMQHYSISLREIDSLSMPEFEQMFVWAAAAEQMKAEEMKKAGSSSTANGMPVGKTDVGKPMPFSEGW